jgi:hypothetical protein
MLKLMTLPSGINRFLKIGLVLVLTVTLLGCSHTATQFRTDGAKMPTPYGCKDLIKRGHEC